MRNDTRVEQIQQILQRLASLPGGEAVDVISKRLPSHGPAETECSYHAMARSFSVGEVPQSLSIPSGTEEVTIRLRGRLPGDTAQDAIVEDLRTFLAESELHENWDVRSHFRNALDPASFELTLLTHQGPGFSPPADTGYWD
jgi:hypothetical protein